MSQSRDEIELVNRLECAIQRAAEMVKQLKGDGSEAERERIRLADEEVKTLTERVNALREKRRG